MKKITLLLNILFVLSAGAQRFEWVNDANVVGGNTIAPVAVDLSGNVFTLIATNTYAVIGTDTVYSITGASGIVITKFDAAGNFLWGKMVNPDGGVIGGEKIV